MSDATRARLAQSIDRIERAYEYLLAYAAQGRRDDAGTEARATLESLHAVLGSIAIEARAAFEQADTDAAAHADGGALAAYFEAIENDARIARGAVALVLSRPRIASLLVDNLNASVHLRALLTDTFLLDQALENS